MGEQDVKGVGIPGAVAIVISSMLGVGVFVSAGVMAESLGSPAQLLLAWLLGGCVTLLGALSLGELGVMFPKAGGDYVYLKEAYGPLAGYLVGWLNGLIVGPCSLAILSLTCISYTLSALAIHGGSAILKSLMAGTLIFGLAGLNIRGTTRVVHFQGVLIGLNLLIMLGMLTFGFLSGKADISRLIAEGSSGLSLNAIGEAMAPVIFSFSGWFASAYIASDLKNPKVTLPLSLVLGSGAVIVLYFLMNVLYLAVLPFDSLKGTTTVAWKAFEAVFGSKGARGVSLVIALSALGGLNAAILTISRVLFAMAQDGLFFSWAGRLHPRHRTPARSIWFLAVLSQLSLFAGGMGEFLRCVGFVMVGISFFTVLGVILLRIRHPDFQRDYRVPFYPLTPILFLILYGWIDISLLRLSPKESLFGLLVTLLGAISYAFLKKRRCSRKVLEENS